MRVSIAEGYSTSTTMRAVSKVAFSPKRQHHIVERQGCRDSAGRVDIRHAKTRHVGDARDAENGREETAPANLRPDRCVVAQRRDRRFYLVDSERVAVVLLDPDVDGKIGTGCGREKAMKTSSPFALGRPVSVDGRGGVSANAFSAVIVDRLSDCHVIATVDDGFNVVRRHAKARSQALSGFRRRTLRRRRGLR
jgi:hypothetical protein